jgi:transcriptional regulator with XRE-family HTH domain
MTSKADVAARMRVLMRRAGLSQADVVTKMNVSKGSVSKWLNGEGKPNLANLKLFAELCGETLGSFFAAPRRTRTRAAS